MPENSLSTLEKAIASGDLNIVLVAAVSSILVFIIGWAGFFMARTQNLSSTSQRELMALAGDIVRDRMNERINPFETEMRTEIERCQKSEKKLTEEVEKLHARIESLETSHKNGD